MHKLRLITKRTHESRMRFCKSNARGSCVLHHAGTPYVLMTTLQQRFGVFCFISACFVLQNAHVKRVDDWPWRSCRPQRKRLAQRSWLGRTTYVAA